MAKGLLFVGFAACLLASGHTLIPLGDLLGSIAKITSTLTDTVGGLSGAVTGTVGGLTNALSGVLGGLTDTVNNLLGSVFDLLDTVVDALLNVVSTVTDVLNYTLDTALGAPLNAVTGLLDSLTGSISPVKIASGLTAGLAPQLKALTSLVKQLSGTVGCVVNTALGNVTKEILTGVKETVKCATPLVKEIAIATRDVGGIVSYTVGLANTILKNITTCTTDAAKANPPALGKIVTCIVQPVGKGVTEVTNILGKTTPIIQNALKTALGVPVCAQKVLADRINNVNSMLKSIVKCATDKGVSTTLPNVPDSLPDFRAIAGKAIEAINAAFAAALDAKSPVTTLLERLQKLKDVADKISPDAIRVAVAKGVKGIQDAIDNIKKQVGNNISSGAKQCFSTVQNLVNDLPAKAVQEISTCAVSISPEAATFIAQAAELDIGLKTKGMEAGVNAFKKCSQYAMATDNSAQMCFDSIISEVKSYIVEQLKKINNAVDTANNLIKKAEDCLTSGISRLDAAGQVIITKLNECLAREGVNTQSQDLSAVLVAGRRDVENSASDFSAALSVFKNAKENIQSSVEYVSTITPEVLEIILGPQITTAKETVVSVENSLADNQNPQVKNCIDSTKNELTKTDSAALEKGAACLDKNKAEAEALSKQILAEETALKSRLANSGADSEAKCKDSVSESAAKSCFENFKVALKAEVDQAINTAQGLVDKAQVVVSATINCVNDASTEVPTQIDGELAKLKTCLTGQGVDPSTFNF